MICPHCQLDNDTVKDSRPRYGGAGVGRRRKCLACQKRWSTIELPAELVEQLVEAVGAYLGVEETIESKSSSSRAILDQFFGLARKGGG